jgi:hypothetical protein
MNPSDGNASSYPAKPEQIKIQNETERRREQHEQIVRGLQNIATGVGMIAAAYARLYLGRV